MRPVKLGAWGVDPVDQKSWVSGSGSAASGGAACQGAAGDPHCQARSRDCAVSAACVPGSRCHLRQPAGACACPKRRDIPLTSFVSLSNPAPASLTAFAIGTLRVTGGYGRPIKILPCEHCCMWVQVGRAEQARLSSHAALEDAARKLHSLEAAQGQHLAACTARQAAAAERETALEAAALQARNDVSVLRCASFACHDGKRSMPGQRCTP